MRRYVLLSLILTCGLALSIINSPASAGTTERVSVSSSGAQGNGDSGYYGVSISADGRYVAFHSYASNLVPSDTNGKSDVFVHDRQTGLIERVSVSSTGGQGNNFSFSPSISADGRYVAFNSFASNLVPSDTNGAYDIFVRDRQTGITERVSVSSTGGQGNSRSEYPSISADGRYVAFQSEAYSLVPSDTNTAKDVFVRDRQEGQTSIVSISSAGEQGKYRSEYPSISADGRYVAFQSDASNLVLGDTNGVTDVFIRDRQTGHLSIVSISSDGALGDSDSVDPSISADGQYIAFSSLASNLVSGDTNEAPDIFVHDHQMGITERVSIMSSGAQGNSDSARASISADGRYVAFTSWASLVPNDTNRTSDIFVRDCQTGITERVSISSSGAQGNFGGSATSISTDGRYVAFSSYTSNLVSGDANGMADVFVYDRQGAEACVITGKITLQGYSGDITKFTISVELRMVGGDTTTRTISLNADGSFILPNVEPGVYDISFRAPHGLKKVVSGVAVN